MEAKEGMRVHVFSSDGDTDLGLGTIEKVEPMGLEGSDEVLCEDYPSVIKLDSGDVTEGMKCWWHPVD